MYASVSVIIPCYRCSKTIKRAVDSVAKQTLVPAEVILIDDGSGDDTLEVLKSLQSEYEQNWIKVVSLESNAGPSTARNIGWDLASQDYIAFLDADDAWYPEKIAIQYSWMLENVHVIGCGHNHVLVKDNSLDLDFGQIESDFTVNLITPNQMLLSNPFTPSSIMLKRKIKYRFDILKKYMEDHVLCMEMCLDGCQFYYLNIKATLYFVTPGSLSSKKLYMRYNAINNYWKLWKKQKINLLTMLFYVQYTFLKGVFSIVFPDLHLFLKRKLNNFPFKS